MLHPCRSYYAFSHSNEQAVPSRRDRTTHVRAQARVLWWCKGPVWSDLACSMARFGRDGPPAGITEEDALLRVPLLPHGAFLHDYSSVGWVFRGTVPPGPSLEGAPDTVAVCSSSNARFVGWGNKHPQTWYCLDAICTLLPTVCIDMCLSHRKQGRVLWARRQRDGGTVKKKNIKSPNRRPCPLLSTMPCGTTRMT